MPPTAVAANPLEGPLLQLACWLDAVPASRPTRVAPTAHDAAALDGLLARVWASGRAASGLARGSRELRRFREIVGPAFWESDCLRRAYVKPRGYPGDFETIQRLYDNKPAGITARGWWLDAWVLSLPYARAVRNRGAMTMSLLAERWAAGARHVLNVGCGAAPELAAVHRLLPYASITLLDQDADALGAAGAALGEGAARRLHARVRDVVEGRCALPRGQDVVYAIGLYDYLSTETAAALTGRLWDALAPGGTLVIGNYAAGDQPDRHLLETVLDWYLHYRTPAELYGLVAGLPGADAVRVHTDPTGSVHLLVATAGDREKIAVRSLVPVGAIGGYGRGDT
jgi:extracellular factor (EF) 3-hydroxypalmitic acid methyl ester biosynthesis protein